MEKDKEELNIYNKIQAVHEVVDYDKVGKNEYPLYEIVFKENKKYVGIIKQFLLGEPQLTGRITEDFAVYNNAFIYILMVKDKIKKQYEKT